MTPSTSIATDTIVYNLHGGEAQYVSSLPNGHHIVRPGYTQYDPDPDVGEYTSYDGVAEWHEVFLKPPVEKLHEEVARLSGQIADLRKTVQVIMGERVVLDRQMAERKARITQHEQLDQLDDYLAGKITHFVVLDHGYGFDRLRGISIRTFKDAVKEDDRYGWDRDRTKLLTLFGDSKGNLTWRINEYAQSSGSHNESVIPCTSLEQARDTARKLYEEELALWRAEQAVPSAPKPAKRPWHASTLVEHAKTLDLPVPQDAVESAARDKRKAMEDAVESARKALLKAEANLQAVQTGEPSSDESVACAPLPA